MTNPYGSLPTAADLVPRASARAMVRAAAVAGHRGVPEITGLLYAAGTMPLSPGRSRAYAPRVIEHLVDSARVRSARVRRAYRRVPHEHWLAFTADPEGDRNTLRHKVYLSVEPSGLFAVLPDALELALDHGAGGFKVGADARGVLRPDKAVVYLTDPVAAQSFAEELDRRVDRACVRTHGVPFTGQVGRTGAVSRGLDPVCAGRPESWRSWLCTTVATALVDAAGGGPMSVPDRIEAASRDLAADGFDTRTWHPDRMSLLGGDVRMRTVA